MRSDDYEGARPPGAEYKMNGLYYKTGVHGFVYYWAGFDNGWLRSTTPSSDLKYQYKLDGR
jgi:hypothetical protein